MSKLFATAIASAIAVASVAFSSPGTKAEPIATARLAQTVSVESNLAGVPADALPNVGQCRIWYDDLAAENQPAQMDCEHADWIAQRWGGRVISHNAELASYDGRNDFTNVPASALPRRGYCSVWLEGAVDHASVDCRQARQAASANGGRVLFMPL